MKRNLAALLALAACIVAVPSQAKQGFYLGANMLFNDFGGEVNDLTSGNGLGLRAGYGLNRHLSFEAGLFKSDHDLKNGAGTADFKGGTIDAKVDFPRSGSHIAPYISAGVGVYKLDYPLETVDGKGGQLGVGMDIELFSEVSLNVGLAWKSITFDATATSPKRTGTVTTLDFGVTYHFI